MKLQLQSSERRQPSFFSFREISDVTYISGSGAKVATVPTYSAGLSLTLANVAVRNSVVDQPIQNLTVTLVIA